MAFFVAPHRRATFRDEAAAIMKRVKADARRRPAVRDGAGRLRLPDQPPRHLRRAPRRRRRHDAAAVLHAPGPPDDRRGDGRTSTRSARPTSTISPTTAETTGELLRVFRTMINNLFPVTRSAGDAASADWDRGRRGDPPRERLRPRPARAAPRGPPARADRPGPQPAAGRRRHPRRRRRRPRPPEGPIPSEAVRRGEAALRDGEVAVVSLAAGVGSRWTTGAGVVKAVNPFVMLAAGTGASWNSTWPRRGRPRRARGRRSRTSSRPAT